ncbi:hypothetical protein [Acidovorax sp. A1169]|uniref:hypothetical protein n=1 Tax=Acidovorax sp. A1169 TaxID=3059524 RepID=UPI002737C213|nr:hypothetical protein [Acidovorax sp. A1169]MDP4076896.1 hypothetical protein [Acidovorax sp. A1169]
MSIVVYWQEAPGVAAMQAFGAHELAPALQFCEARRKAGKRHVSLSTELTESVGRPGVNTVEARLLPDGTPYDWTKTHRGAGPDTPVGSNGGA